MYILLGDRYTTEGDYERAIQLFNHARASSSSPKSPRLELISLVRRAPWSDPHGRSVFLCRFPDGALMDLR